MNYLNHAIYCKENLKETDRQKLEYWYGVFLNLIENEKKEACIGSSTLDKIKEELVSSFCNDLHDALDIEMQENLISIIDNYKEDEFPVQKEWHTFIGNYDD